MVGAKETYDYIKNMLILCRNRLSKHIVRQARNIVQDAHLIDIVTCANKHESSQKKYSLQP